MNNSTLRFFAIMHQKLCSLDNCLKLLYHLVSGQTHTWSESNANVKDAIKAAKRETIDHIRRECGFLVDCPTSIEGNTNTGPIADQFFSAKNSVHQMSAHSWELFMLTEGKPIATYAEQSGEAWNKHIRAYKSGLASRARQCSIRLNTLDIFTRMLVQSHPITASKRKVLQSKRCAKHGHTVRSCPMNLATVRDNEQSFIDSCYI